jgi:DNA-binding transcriptional MerR regulator
VTGRLAVLTIGGFAKLAAVSVKTLRFYERVGLFPPAAVDPASRYRYYVIEQLPALQELRLLRELGCSIADLRQWLAAADGSGSPLALLLCLRERLQRRMRDDRDRLCYVERWIDRLSSRPPFGPHPPPTIRCLPPLPALTIRERVRGVGPAIYRMFESAERLAARHEARAAQRPFLLLHDGCYPKRSADVEVCVPVLPKALRAVGGRMVEGVERAACLQFRGGYERGPAVASALEDWLRTSGARAAGPLRESYLRFNADQRGYKLPARFLARRVADYRTELQLPITAA